MVVGVGLAIHDLTTSHLNEIHASQPAPMVWNIPSGNVLPLDLQLSLDKRQSNGSVRDSINIIDSIRWTDKIRYRIKYKTVPNCAKAQPETVIPDSLAGRTNECTLVREEKTKETVDTSKVSSIQLIIDGETVYSKNDNHSTGESQ